MMTTTMQEILKTIRDTLSRGLIERESAVRLALVSALAGEHLLLLGPPGTAKSVLARRLNLAFEGGNYFERLLTRFSVPEELFGPLSIKALQDDRYERQTQHYLPTAHIAFIDEIFKANSAILNALLTLLNEREFDNGSERQKTPLIAVIAASNELPEGEELDALYDRFLCRYQVQPVSQAGFSTLLTLEEADLKTPSMPTTLSLQELEDIQQSAQQISLDEDILQLLKNLRDFLKQQRIPVSDRRWRKVVKLMKVSAHTNGRKSVSVWDGWLLSHCLWHEPAQYRLVSDWYQRHVGIGSGFNKERLERLVHTWELTLQKESSNQTQATDATGKHLYKDQNGNPSQVREYQEKAFAHGEALYLAPPDEEDRSNNGAGYTEGALKEAFFDDTYQQCHVNGEWQHLNDYINTSVNHLHRLHKNTPIMQPTLHPENFVASRIKEISAIHSDIEKLQQTLQSQLDSTDQVVGEHLWIAPDFIHQAEASLSSAVDAARSLGLRLKSVTQGYANLPTL